MERYGYYGQMTAIGYYNGKTDALENLTIPLLDRAAYFGDGCYEACFVRNGRGFGLDAHVKRFYASLSLLRIAPPCAPDALKAILADCVAAANEPNALLYWQCSRGTAERKHAFPDASVPPNLTVTVTPKPLPMPHASVRLMTAEDIRYAMCNVKTLNLLPNVLTNQRAIERGLDGAIFVRDGIVTEATHSNVHILKDGALLTHPADRYILDGITRGRLLAICRDLGVPVREEPFPKEALFTADAILISASAAGVRTVTELDGQSVGGRATDLAHSIQAAYYRQFMEETAE